MNSNKFLFLKNTLLFFAFFTCEVCFCQNDSALINYIINTDSVIIEEGKSFSIKATLINRTDITFILYAFYLMEDGFSSEGNFCDRNKTAGSVFLLDKKNKQIFSEKYLGDHNQNEPFTKEYVTKVHDQIISDFSAKKLILSSKDTTEINFSIDLSNFRYLYPGDYGLKLVYYCGDNLGNMVDFNRQLLDCQKYKAAIFKGCLISNRIKIINKCSSW